MWRNIFSFLSIGVIVSCLFLWSRFIKFGIIKKISNGKLWLRLILGLIPVGLMAAFVLVDQMNASIVIVHMCIVWILAELIALPIRKILKSKRKKIGTDDDTADSKREYAADTEVNSTPASVKRSLKPIKPYTVGIVVLCIEICYFASGWFLAHHMFETDYQITTEKDIGAEAIRVAVISDVHLGAVFDGNGFRERIEKIQAVNPDVLLIVGDFVDNDTTKEDLLIACEALSE